MIIRYKLPWPPSVNAIWRSWVNTAGGVEVSLSAEARDYRTRGMQAISDHKLPWAMRFRNDERLRIHLWLYPPNRRARDIDNHAKSVLDLLEVAKIFKNDSQVDELFIYRSGLGGYCIVEVQEIADNPEEE